MDRNMALDRHARTKLMATSDNEQRVASVGRECYLIITGTLSIERLG